MLANVEFCVEKYALSCCSKTSFGLQLCRLALFAPLAGTLASFGLLLMHIKTLLAPK